MQAQLMTVLAHDAGHTCVTGNWWWDRMIGMLVANYIGGLSLGWWCDVSPIIYSMMTS
jgi:delta8-fatty-acid desaturase